jgi:hypothetical protein
VSLYVCVRISFDTHVFVCMGTDVYVCFCLICIYAWVCVLQAGDKGVCIACMHVFACMRTDLYVLVCMFAYLYSCLDMRFFSRAGEKKHVQGKRVKTIGLVTTICVACKSGNGCTCCL